MRIRPARTSVVFSSSLEMLEPKYDDQSDQSAGESVIDKTADAHCFPQHDQQESRRHCHGAEKACCEKRNNEKTHTLDRIGIDSRPIRRNDADGEREARGHAGDDKSEDNDDDPAKQ